MPATSQIHGVLPHKGTIALLSHSLPPDPTGQARVLSKVLGDIPADKLILATEQRTDNPAWEIKGRYVFLQPASEKALPLPPLPGLRRLNAIMGLRRSIKLRARELAQALKPYDPAVLVGCTGTVIDPPAGLLAARELGIPYIIYSFDDYRYQWQPGIHRTVAKRWEAQLMHGADQVIVPNSTFAQAYAQRYQINPSVVANPAEPAAYAKERLPWPFKPGAMSVVFTGSVYWGHYDALRGVAQALDALGAGARLHIYSDQSPQTLEENSITGPIEHHDFVQPPDIFQVQQTADVLLLPLSFNSSIPEAVRTACPAKVGEYLASGRPILAHVPPDCFVGKLFKERACAAVVDRQDKGELLNALQRIRDDAAWREELVKNALATAQEFTEETARRSLGAVLAQAMGNEA